jgi:hypothetical protein
MSVTYRAVMFTRKGSPKALDVLQVVNLPISEYRTGSRSRNSGDTKAGRPFLSVTGGYSP